MTTQTPYEQLWAFQEAFDLNRSKTPALPDAGERKLRRKLLIEEYNEFLEAEIDHDLVEVADALGDIMYIALGTVVSYGLSVDATYQDVSGAPGFTSKAERRTNRVELTATLNYYLEGEQESDLDYIGYALGRLLDTINAVAANYSLPLKEIFDEIHASNMTKLDPATGKPIRREDGKILKPASFRKPDLGSIIERHQNKG